ncbi:hypothetical protein B7494_g2788 [Chlorociboria aeruginascens]|nr:hypothetical protein B7494_g2788 [Chlorociboria aeruginascens]
MSFKKEDTEQEGNNGDGYGEYGDDNANYSGTEQCSFGSDNEYDDFQPNPLTNSFLSQNSAYGYYSTQGSTEFRGYSSGAGLYGSAPNPFNHNHYEQWDGDLVHRPIGPSSSGAGYGYYANHSTNPTSYQGHEGEEEKEERHMQSNPGDYITPNHPIGPSPYGQNYPSALIGSTSNISWIAPSQEQQFGYFPGQPGTQYSGKHLESPTGNSGSDYYKDQEAALYDEQHEGQNFNAGDYEELHGAAGYQSVYTPGEGHFHALEHGNAEEHNNEDPYKAEDQGDHESGGHEYQGIGNYQDQHEEDYQGHNQDGRSEEEEQIQTPSPHKKPSERPSKRKRSAAKTHRDIIRRNLIKRNNPSYKSLNDVKKHRKPELPWTYEEKEFVEEKIKESMAANQRRPTREDWLAIARSLNKSFKGQFLSTGHPLVPKINPGTESGDIENLVNLKDRMILPRTGAAVRKAATKWLDTIKLMDSLEDQFGEEEEKKNISGEEIENDDQELSFLLEGEEEEEEEAADDTEYFPSDDDEPSKISQKPKDDKDDGGASSSWQQLRQQTYREQVRDKLGKRWVRGG